MKSGNDNSPLYKASKVLWDQGFAIHWLRPKSKVPLEGGWTSGPRAEWERLESTYSEGLNVGVRLGRASKIGNGYLAVVDVDVKSSKPEHRKAALVAANALLGLHAKECPVVSSGRGNGSRHYYCRTKEPFKTWNYAVSSEKVKVHMPSKAPSRAEMAQLTKEEITKGLRISNAWEVSLYSEGRQVVLPPSIHPDSGRAYEWKREFNGPPPLVTFPDTPIKDKPAKTAKADKPNANGIEVKDLEGEMFQDMVFPKVDLEWLPISDKMRNAILYGEGVEDRSACLLPATSALISAGLSTMEVLSVLTDPKTYLGETAYDHAKTQSRKAAARWLWRYTVKKVVAEKDPKVIFAAPVVRYEPLPPDEAKAQDDELRAEGFNDWRNDLVRGGKGGEGSLIPTIQNVVLIMKNVVSPQIVRHNEFALRDTYSIDTPWGVKKDALVGDNDVPRIIHWLGQQFKFEPPARVIEGALTVIALDNSFDPVRDHLDALAPWDGIPRLATWLRDHFEAEGHPSYLAQVFMKWMTAMVRRIYEPGAKFDWMPIFEGPQGVGKSSFGRILVGDIYFVDWLPNLADKDSALSLQGRWCCEMGELSQFRKNELETIKAFITRTIDKFRPPHAKKLIDSPRRVVFFGTTNRETYLIDDTGNRRFKPVKVGKLDFEVLKRERDQLFAEAKHLYRTKLNTDLAFELTGDARIFEAQIHAEKMVEDEATVMREAMQDFIVKVHEKRASFDFKKFRMLELFSGVGPLVKWQQNTRNFMFAGKMLKKMGAKKTTMKGLGFWKMDVSGLEVGTSDDEVPTQDFY